jgi:hypothetical protein
LSYLKRKKSVKSIYQNKWWFSVIDVIAALTDSTQPSKYWTAMKARVGDEGFRLSTITQKR